MARAVFAPDSFGGTTARLLVDLCALVTSQERHLASRARGTFPINAST